MKRIFIVGAMGAGKTAVGRELARALKFSFHDTDQEVCERTGVDIAFIFEKEGESGFRNRETQALSDLAKQNECVIATGGGIVVGAFNNNLMKSSGVVVYLAVSPEVQKIRARRGPNRPLLDHEDLDQTLTKLAVARSPLYSAIADIVVETDYRRVGDVTHEVLEKLREFHGTQGSRDSS
ncbi:MAG: shikimate kinase [Gammaproteobacteria bacterium]